MADNIDCLNIRKTNMANYAVTLINGDGTGPELAAVARKCVDAALASTPGAGRIDWWLCD